jgi:hypothetical protein
MVDVPAEVATTASDLTKFVIERVAPHGWILVEIDGRLCCVTVAFDNAALRMNELMDLAVAGDGPEEKTPEQT